jgi:hypothetical protein
MSRSFTPPYARWAELIPQDQWEIFLLGREIARGVKVPILLGGALALAAYTGRWRNTKDLDFFVHAGDQQKMVDALLSHGFVDYYPQQQYDRSWIFRAFRDGVILDIIWTLPNHRVDVDEGWFEYARDVNLRGEVGQAVALEELIRVKLYVMQRDRCDWVDVLNLFAGAVGQVDWDYLIARMDRDLPLLQSMLTLFSWLAPNRAALIPAGVRERFALPIVATEDAAATERRRVRLLDSRPWYAAFQPEDQPLER